MPPDEIAELQLDHLSVPPDSPAAHSFAPDAAWTNPSTGETEPKLNAQDRTFLQGQLSLLTQNEKLKLFKRAALMRKTAPKVTTKRHVDFDGDEEEATQYRVEKRKASLDDLIVKLLREDARAAEAEAAPNADVAMVLSIHKGRCEVLRSEGESFIAELSPEIARTQQTSLAVGDRVVLQTREEHVIVVGVLARQTKLSRPDPATETRERVIVANIDVTVVVVSVGSPPLHPRLIDRYLVAIQRGGSRPVIAVNKIDLLTDPEELNQLEPYRQVGIPIYHCSAAGKIGQEELRAELVGQTAAFVGHSGVGKSSLLNSLRPELNLEVGSVSHGNARGAHTTRRSTLYRLPNGTNIIDTPGIRSFGLWSMTTDEIEDGFPEFASLTCRFRDCSHVHEPGCGVRAAVESGAVSQYRYETFLRLSDSL